MVFLKQERLCISTALYADLMIDRRIFQVEFYIVDFADFFLKKFE